MSTAVISAFLARKRLSPKQTERRQLEPICNALQQNNNKLALRLCTKTLDKSPDLHIARALKAVCLYRLARYQEAVGVANALAANQKALADADVLLFVSWMYQEAGHKQAILDMFDEATRLQGFSEDVGIEAFCHFVREGEIKRMQQLALKLYKLIEQPKMAQLQPLPNSSSSMTLAPPKYLYWCLMCIVLQASAMPPLHSTTAVLCSLGARLITSARSLIGAKEMTLGDTAQEFFIRTRMIAIRARAWKRPSSGAAPPPTTSALPPGSSDADYARAELLNAFVGPDGNKWCERHLGLELWRREQEWQLGGEHEWERGRGRCMKRLREGDTNWSTILYLIRFTLKLWHARQHRTRLMQTTEVPNGLTSLDQVDAEWEDVGETDAEEAVDVERSSVIDPLSASVASLSTTDSLAPSLSPTVDMSTELLRWTYDRLFSLSHAPGHRQAAAKAKRANGKGKGKAAEIEYDSDEDRYRLPKVARRDRGYLLGLLELVRLSRLENVPTPSTNSSSLPELIVEYAQTFGDKIVCFEDLLPYLRALTCEERRIVIESDLAYQGLGGDEETSFDALQSLSNIEKIQRALQSCHSTDTREQQIQAARYLNLYFSGLLSGKGLAETDLQPADDLALLAAQAHLSAWGSSKDLAHMERAIVILEYALKRSKYKYQMRLLLIRLYLLSGAPSCALRHFEILDPKQIQLDTLSHFLLTRASTFSLAASGDASMLCEAAETVHWYRSSEVEATEACIRIWSRGTYTKIEDYAEFRDRLQHSLTKFLTQLEHIRMRLLQGPLAPNDLASIRALLQAMLEETEDGVRDNRDFEVLTNLQPLDAPSVLVMTSLGPQPTLHFLHVICAAYAVFLGRSAGPKPPVVTPTHTYAEDRMHCLTKTEEAFAQFAESVDSESGNELQLTDSGGTLCVLKAFLEARTTEITALVADRTALTWRIAHNAQLALEAFCLVEQALCLQLSRRSAGASPARTRLSVNDAASKTDATDIGAQLEDAKFPLRAIVRQLQLHAEVIKPNEGIARVSDLSAYPLLDGSLDEIATTLAAARRAYVKNLADSITGRISYTQLEGI